MKHFYVWLMLCCPFFCIAQSNYKPGAIVTLKGDTVKGYIDYQEWEANPKSVNFKTSLTSVTRPARYFPQDIRFFKVNDLEDYQSYSGRISMDDTNIQHLTREKDTSSTIANIFLKQLATGPAVNFYSYTDYKKTRYFIQQSGQPEPKELVFRVYISTTSMTSTVYDNGYMQQLYLIAESQNRATDQLKNQIEHTDYRADYLLRIINILNGASNQPVKRAKNAPKPFKLYAGVGANVSFYDAFGHYKDLGGGQHTSVLPKATVGVLLFVNPNTQRTAFRVEGSIASGHYKSAYSYYSTTDIEPHAVDFNQLTYSLTPQVTYNIYNAKDFKFYAGAGIGFNFYSFKDNALRNTLLFIYGNYDTAAILRTGFILNEHINIDFQYLTKTTLTRNDLYGIQVGAIQLGVNYIFGK
ncbi:outer membrane beta-barrel protein [Mucilaginibacter sp.]